MMSSQSTFQNRDKFVSLNQTIPAVSMIGATATIAVGLLIAIRREDEEWFTVASLRSPLRSLATLLVKARWVFNRIM